MEKYPVVSTGYFLGKRHTVPQCAKFQFIGLLNRYRITHVIANPRMRVWRSLVYFQGFLFFEIATSLRSSQ